MKNEIKILAEYLFFLLNLIPRGYCSYKIDNIAIKKSQFSDVFERTVNRINKQIKSSNENYDVCTYKKIPRVLLERNKLKDNKKWKYIVGIENTCDDTCICIIDSQLNIVKNVVISHYKVVHMYEGVYPFFISSLNDLFLKPYADKVLESIDTDQISCLAFSACPGIAKNMEAAKNYIGELKKKNGQIKVSSVNHVFAHVLSPLFFHFYNDKNTYTNSSQYKDENINGDKKKEFPIVINMSQSIKRDDALRNKIKDILRVLNNNDVTKEKLKNLNEDKFLNYGSYILKKKNEKKGEEKGDKEEDENRNINKTIAVANFSKSERSYLTEGYICILVSGGSTEVYKVQKNKRNDINVVKISQTVDISIGDIIDKVARLLELPVGLGGGPFLEKKAQEFIARLKGRTVSDGEYTDPFQPFPTPFLANNRIDFSFSGIFNHMSKIISAVKGEKFFEEETDRYAYYCQKNIFKHLLRQISKIMYFSELHFNIKNIFIVGGVGCNNFLYQTLKYMIQSRDKKENQIKEYTKLKKRLKKKIKKIEMEKYKTTKMRKDISENKDEINSSVAWNIYLKNLLKRKTKENILLALKSFNFENFIELKKRGCFLLEAPWNVYKTPSNLSRDNAAMVCYNALLNMHNNVNLHEDISNVKIKTTVKTKVENNFLLFSDIIIFDVFMDHLDGKKL
ncbi:tRNA N6-adenosine threonylcarbamoyltransferase, putative [Plasmodium ovale]|uniref:tRNA N6-adenosine threonylcarbamoyltransferase, putative n=1 Tax=Plasmodium ovale TaxID=36330 RepID=A0A1D3KXG1_PLAOA|nr:tRNA N6-adenosine threonylcarbamoyltransferase, putative [Plasmodium ovale]